MALLVLSATVFGADYYFTPEDSLDQAVALALPGNRLFFQRGGKWYGQQLDLTGKQGTGTTPTTQIEIGAYGPGDPPIISTLILLPNTGWDRLPNTTIWHRSVGYPNVLRLYVNGQSKYRVNTINTNLNEYDVDETDEWYFKSTGSVVYVNNGSTTVQPSGVEIHPSTAGAALYMKNARFVKISGIEFRGGSVNDVVHVEAPCHQIYLTGNRIMQSNKSGIVVGNTESLNPTTNWVTNVYVTGNLVDKVWTSRENQTNSVLTGDGIFFVHAVETGRIADNDVTNFGHVGITLSGYRPGYYGVKNIIVEDNDITAGRSGYMHGIDVSGIFDCKAEYNIVRRNFIYNYTSTCHLMGNNNQFYSNIFAGVRETQMGAQHTQNQAWGADIWPWTNSEYGPTRWIESYNNVIAHNVFYDTDAFSIRMAQPPGAPQVNNIWLLNNLFVNYGMNTTEARVALNITASVTGAVFVRNNGFWSTITSNPPTDVVAWCKTAQYTAAGLQGGYPNYCSDNEQMDPYFGNTSLNMFHLQNVPANAALRTGGMDARPWCPGLRDHFDDAFIFPNPSIGAIQWR